MALKVAGQQHQAPLVTGAQDFTPTVHGGAPTEFIFSGDVKAAILFASAASANSTITPKARFMYGFTDGTTHACLSTSGADGVTTSQWRSTLRSARAATFLNEANGADLAVATASFVDNGLRLNWTTVDAVSVNRICALLIGGSGIEAQVLNKSFVGGSAETLTCTHTLSGAPDLVIAIESTATINTQFGQGRYSIGFYAKVAGTYVCLAGTRLDGQTTEQLAQILSTTYAAAQLASGGTPDYTVTLGNFTSSTFDAVTNANAGTDAISFLLLKWPNAEVKTGTYDLPTNGTEYALMTGLTKRPKAMLSLSSVLTSVGTASVSDNADWMGAGALWDNNGFVEQFCSGNSSDDAATGTNALKNKSITSALLVQIGKQDGTGSLIVGGGTSINDDGVSAQLTTFDATVRKQGWMTLSDAAPPPSIATVGTIQPGQSFTITGVNFTGSGNAVKINGVTQTITSQSTTSITCTAVLGLNLYLMDLGLVVTNSASLSSVPFTAQYALESGVKLVTEVDPLVPTTERPTATPDIDGADQIKYGFVTGGSTSDVQLNADGSYESASASVTKFKYNVGDSTGWDSDLLDGSDWAEITLTYPSAAPVVGTIPDFGYAVGIPLIISLATSATGATSSALQSGSLPHGVVFVSGTLVGVPIQPGDFVLVVRFTNSTGHTDSNAFHLKSQRRRNVTHTERRRRFE